MIRRFVPFGVALAAFALPATVSAASNPQSIVLRASDVPKNYHAVMSFRVNTPLLVATTIKSKVYTRHGRLGGYMAEFAPRRSTPAVASLVAQYKDPAGAHWELQNVRSRMSARHVAASGVGDESFAFSYQSGKKTTLTAIFGIAFRQGRYAIEVTEVGKPAAVSIDDVVRYAHIVDNRAKKG